MGFEGRRHGRIEVAVTYVIRKDDFVDGDAVADLGEASDMVLVEVGQDHQIQLLDLESMQRFKDLIPVVLLACVNEHVVPIEGQEGTVSLAYGKGVDIHALHGRRGATEEHGQAYEDGEYGFHVG